MAVKIRLRRCGEKNTPYFRVIVADTRSPVKGRYLENVGWYDPARKREDRFHLNMERIDYWEAQGAEISDTVRSMVRRVRRQKPASPVAAEGANEPAPVPEEPVKIAETDAPETAGTKDAPAPASPEAS